MLYYAYRIVYLHDLFAEFFLYIAVGTYPPVSLGWAATLGFGAWLGAEDIAIDEKPVFEMYVVGSPAVAPEPDGLDGGRRLFSLWRLWLGT